MCHSYPVFLKLPGLKNKMAEKKPSKTNLLDDLKQDKAESPLDFLCKLCIFLAELL